MLLAKQKSFVTIQTAWQLYQKPSFVWLYYLMEKSRSQKVKLQCCHNAMDYSLLFYFFCDSIEL
jgi:peroxiredoxin family protein